MCSYDGGAAVGSSVDEGGSGYYATDSDEVAEMVASLEDEYGLAELEAKASLQSNFE